MYINASKTRCFFNHACNTLITYTKTKVLKIADIRKKTKTFHRCDYVINNVIVGKYHMSHNQ